MRNKTVFLIFYLISSFLLVHAQNNWSSPYSRYSIGDMCGKTVGITDALSGTAIALRTPFGLNILNPASYSSMDTLSFIFETGLKNKYTIFETASQKNYSQDANVSCIAMGFPFLFKWWYASIGVIPYSRVGYNIIDEYKQENIGRITSRYLGSGGLNQVYFGHSFLLYKKLSLGVNASYLFGPLIYSSEVTFPDDKNAFSYYSFDTTSVSDIYFNYGLQYQDTLTLKWHKRNRKDTSSGNKTEMKTVEKKYRFTIGLIFDNKSNIRARRTRYAHMFGNGYGLFQRLDDSIVEKGTIVLPLKYGLGLSVQDGDRLLLAADFTRENWSDALFFDEKDSLVNSNTFSLGFQFVPDVFSYTYWKRINFRAGAYYTSTCLHLKNTQINDYGFSVGFGFPPFVSQKSSFYVKGRLPKTSLNIFFKVGQRGTIEKKLIKETYYTVGLNLTLYDIWFVRPKID